MRSAVNVTALGTLALLSVAVTPLAANARTTTPLSSNGTGVGPEADYPVVVGDPFTIDGKTYVPRDTMNYDAVGYAEAGEGGDRVVGAHRTLPLPSYAEVTSLASGKTILVRITQRGPMAGPNLVALSAGAWAQLGLASGGNAPVRVRRVNPPESERALLRQGQHAPDRMETPQGLLGVLKRKLGESSVAVLSESARGPGTNAMAAPAAPANSRLTPPAPLTPAQPTLHKPAPAKPRIDGKITDTGTTAKPSNAAPAKRVSVAPQPASKSAKPLEPASVDTAVKTAKPPAQTSGKAGQFVQVGAYSDEARAKAVAARIGAEVAHAGKVWRVRLGPFEDQAGVARGLEKARAAGYTDSQIVHDR